MTNVAAKKSRQWSKIYEKTEILKKIYQEIFTYIPWYIFSYFHILISREISTCLHGARPQRSFPSGFPGVASSWCNPYSEPPGMTSWLYDDIMLKWDHDHMMTSCWDDIMIIGYHIQGTFLCIHTTCDDHEKNDIMMRWHDDTHCKVVAIPTGSQRVPLPVESSPCEIGNVQTVLWLLIKMI